MEYVYAALLLDAAGKDFYRRAHRELYVSRFYVLLPKLLCKGRW